MSQRHSQSTDRSQRVNQRDKRQGEGEDRPENKEADVAINFRKDFEGGGEGRRRTEKVKQGRGEDRSPVETTGRIGCRFGLRVTDKLRQQENGNTPDQSSFARGAAAGGGGRGERGFEILNIKFPGPAQNASGSDAWTSSREFVKF